MDEDEHVAWLREQVEKPRLDPSGTSGDLNEGYIDSLLDSLTVLLKRYESSN